ncbi:MAG: transcription antitermination factor NusB [Aquificaceae bacterium]
MIHRKRSRRDAFLILYQWEITGKDLEELTESFYKCFRAHSERKRYTRMIIRLFKQNIQTLEKRLAQQLKGRDLMSLGSIERAILRVAITEIELKKTQKPSVAIKDYVRITSRYSDSSQVKLVNGVLGQLFKNLSFPEP